MPNATMKRKTSDSKRYQETFETWNKAAALYEKKFMDMNRYDSTYDFVCQSLTKAHSQILEIGCGPGNITRYFLHKRPDFEILGIDVAPEMIERAKKNNPKAQFAVRDCRTVSKIGKCFDGIICGFCLPYLSPEDAKKLIKDCQMILNDDGLLYISFVEGKPSNSGYRKASDGQRLYFYYYELAWVKKQLYQYNLLDIVVYVEEYPLSESETELHTIVISRKKK